MSKPRTIIFATLLSFVGILGLILIFSQISQASRQSNQITIKSSLQSYIEQHGNKETRRQTFLKSTENASIAELFSSIQAGDHFGVVLLPGISPGPFNYVVMNSIASDHRVTQIIESGKGLDDAGMRDIALAFFEDCFLDRVKNYTPATGGQVYTNKEYAVDVGLFLCSRYCSVEDTLNLVDRWCSWCDSTNRKPDDLFIANLYVQMIEQRGGSVAELLEFGCPPVQRRKLSLLGLDTAEEIAVLPSNTKFSSNSETRFLAMQSLRDVLENF